MEKKDTGRAKRYRGFLKQGFYSEVFSEEEVNDLAAAAEKADLQDEINLLKVMIRRQLNKEKDGKDPDLTAIGRWVDTLCRAVKAQHSLKGKAVRKLAEAVPAVLMEIADEMGWPYGKECGNGNGTGQSGSGASAQQEEGGADRG